MTLPPHAVIRGGRLLDAAAHRAEPADILIARDTILEVGQPGMAAPEGAPIIDAEGWLLMPGLVNAHTHGHGSLSKGMGDRWSLELLLNAAPWISGNRSLEDNYLCAFLNAVEMVRRGCTAAYDLPYEFPLPSPEGMTAVGRAYADVGLRFVPFHGAAVTTTTDPDGDYEVQVTVTDDGTVCYQGVITSLWAR